MALWPTCPTPVLEPRPHTEYMIYIYIHTYNMIYIYGPESKLCMERSAVFRTYGTKGFRNWSCSGPLECDEI